MTVQTAPRSKAQILRDSVEIRLAVNSAGPEIEKLLALNGIKLEGADWNNVFPHWLIACVEELVIGCVQVMPSKPVGYLEFLFVHPDTPFKFRAVAIRKLWLQGTATLYHAGCNYVGGAVATGNRKFANVLENLRCVKTYQADLWVKRLT